MAIRHGLAGQYAKSEAMKRFHRIVDRYFTAGALLSAVIGFVAGYVMRSGGYWPLVLVPVSIAIYIAGKRYASGMDRELNKVAKERIKYLRGGQTEALIAWLLEDLDDRWHLFNGIKLEAGSDIDHVLVGPGGLYSISTKSQRGHFKVLPGGLLHNGHPSTFAKQASAQAMRLKDRLGAMMGADVPWVQPVLAVPFGFVEGDACGKVWIVHQEDIARRLAPEEGPERLKQDQVARMANVLEMIQASAADVYRRATPANVE